MDIYQESYEQIEKKINLAEKHSHPSKVEAELDMFSDDFESKEKDKIVPEEGKINSGIKNLSCKMNSNSCIGVFPTRNIYVKFVI